jgi:DNA-binding MarR family transcriptional regulator
MTRQPQPYDGGVIDNAAPRWLDEREQRAWRAFTRMHRRLFAAVQRDLQREAGLSGPDYAVLTGLSEAPGGTLRAHQLAALAGWEKSRLSHHLTRMAQRGLIERRTCSEDARYADIVLTEAGREAIVAAAPRHVSRIREWFIEAMTPAELEAFAAACDAVSTRLDDPECGEPTC